MVVLNRSFTLLATSAPKRSTTSPQVTKLLKPKEQACPFLKKLNQAQKASGVSIHNGDHWFFGGLEIFEKFLNVFEKLVFGFPGLVKEVAAEHGIEFLGLSGVKVGTEKVGELHFGDARCQL